MTIKIPEFIAKELGKTVEDILKKKSSEPQKREITIQEPAGKIQVTPDECKALCKAIGVEYRAGYEARILSYTCSDESVDRYGDIIRQGGWDISAYNKNPVVMGFHNYTTGPIANALKTWVDIEAKKLKMWVLFPDETVSADSEKIFKLANSGFMKGGSVGLIPKTVNHSLTASDKEKLGMTPWGVEFLNQELIEFSLVGVPANGNALQESINKGMITKKDLSGIIDKATFDLLKEVETQPAPTPIFEDMKKYMDEKLAQFADAQTKAGAVLSKKNKEMLNACVTQMNEATNAIKELLNSTEKPETPPAETDSLLGDNEPDEDQKNIYAAVEMLQNPFKS